MNETQNHLERLIKAEDALRARGDRYARVEHWPSKELLGAMHGLRGQEIAPIEDHLLLVELLAARKDRHSDLARGYAMPARTNEIGQEKWNEHQRQTIENVLAWLPQWNGQVPPNRKLKSWDEFEPEFTP